MDRPARIDVVGLGPGPPGLVTAATRALLDGPAPLFLRTTRHPSAAGLGPVRSFDDLYELGGSFDEVYDAVVDDLVGQALVSRHLVYAVPGSPSVAERTVVLLAGATEVAVGTVEVVVHPAVSFVDLAVARLGVDPVASGLRLVDGPSFAVEAAGERGPLLVAQCYDRSVLSGVKLAPEVPPEVTVTLLHHLGLDDERVVEVAWADLDRTLEPDHLTSVWIPALAAPVASELVALEELVRTLRERCPWDARQTHGSLARHLLEESYEALEAVDEVAAVDGDVGSGLRPPSGSVPDERVAVGHLEEELGDLLFQIYFHATLAAEAGRFTLADVARGIHDKLVARHPHVFGGDEAAGADDVAAAWEVRKLAEKGRTSVTEGIPTALPALALTAKLQRKAASVGLELPDAATAARGAAGHVARLAAPAGPDAELDVGAVVGELLFEIVRLASEVGVDPETALRGRATAFREEVARRG